jgi:peroxiredoxin Q/BCP
MKEIAGFDAALPQFEAAGAQVVGVSADHAATLDAFAKQQGTKHVLLSDFRRTMLAAYGAMETNEASPIYRYAKRAYFVIDREGVVRYMKVMQNPLELLNPDEVVKALKDSGAK